MISFPNEQAIDQASACLMSNGNIAIAYPKYQDGNIDIYLQVINQVGQRIYPEKIISGKKGNLFEQSSPDISSLLNNQIVVVWAEYDYQGALTTPQLNVVGCF